MAVMETKNQSTLKIKFDCGLDNNGKTIVKNRSYSNVKADATSQDILDVANGIIALQMNSSLEILKQDNTILN
ncbi:DUF1659 domain-containing protein [Paraclostridium bifermentans]|uniref:DUF1659 domain-containing protein n=1 Tax=Paraclostridium bifermentans TaxID=1490 RepID=UPI00359C62E6